MLKWVFTILCILNVFWFIGCPGTSSDESDDDNTEAYQRTLEEEHVNMFANNAAEYTQWPYLNTVGSSTSYCQRCMKETIIVRNIRASSILTQATLIYRRLGGQRPRIIRALACYTNGNDFYVLARSSTDNCVYLLEDADIDEVHSYHITQKVCNFEDNSDTEPEGRAYWQRGVRRARARMASSAPAHEQSEPYISIFDVTHDVTV